MNSDQFIQPPEASEAALSESKPMSEKASLPSRVIRRLLRGTGYSLTRTVPRTELVCQHIPGWFSVQEAEALYMLVATSLADRILEIGHFLGRSTSAICEAIRDAARRVEFNSYDLGFTSAEEFVAHYKRVHDTTSTQVPKEFERLVFSQNTTTSEIAKHHLERFNLEQFVNLISGDFTVLDQSRYGLIFCDAMHDGGEINVNLPHIVSASEDECIWAFHDMSPANVLHVLRHPNVRRIRVIDTLGIFRFQRSG